MGESDGGCGRYECVENLKRANDRAYAATFEMRGNGAALAY
jgi:gamma-glutamyltranspeptidase/glutathione hydrolase